MTYLSLAIASTFVAALALPQSTPTPTSDVLIPPVIWHLVELTSGDSRSNENADPVRYTVQFLPDNKLAIGADCNAVTGSYTIARDTLHIKLGASTLALCPDDSQATPFLGILESASTFSFDDEGHLLLAGDAGSLRFRPSLQGVTWEWLDFRGGDDSVVTPRDPRQYTLAFLPDGKLAVKADCNRAIGVYAIHGPRLDLTIAGVTRALCPPGSLMMKFLRDLGYASSHVFRDGNLYLALPADAGIMAFRARYDPPANATPESG